MSSASAEAALPSIAERSTPPAIDPDDPAWKVPQNLFSICAHRCPHPHNSNRSILPHCWLFLDVGGRQKYHAKNFKHSHCNSNCPMNGAEGLLQEPTLAMAVRGIILISQAWHSLKKKDAEHEKLGVTVKSSTKEFNVAETSKLKDIDLGRVLHGELFELWKAAPDLPALINSNCTDGALGIPNDATWDMDHVQYQDIPTHLNPAPRFFDMAAALRGDPAMPGSPVPSSGPIILGLSAGPPVTPTQLPSFSLDESSATLSFPSPTVPGPHVPQIQNMVSSSSLSSTIPRSLLPPSISNVEELRNDWDMQIDVGSRSPFLLERESGLPPSVIFVPPPMRKSHRLLYTLEEAKECVAHQFYWCISQWDMRSERRRMFIRLVEDVTDVWIRSYIYFDTSSGLEFTNIYMYEWIAVALCLYDRGVEIRFIPSEGLNDALKKGAGSIHWETLLQCSLVLGQNIKEIVEDDGNPLMYYPMSVIEDKNYCTLSKSGIRFWPDRLGQELVDRKFTLLKRLAEIVHEAGGLAEIPVKVESEAHGLELLETGWVVKREFSAEGKHVYKRNSEVVRKRFVDDYSHQSAEHIFFGVRRNSALIDRGEVRVYIAYGEIPLLVHTVPFCDRSRGDRPDDDRADWKGIAATYCGGHLQSLKSMKPGDISIQENRNFDRLWHHPAGAWNSAGTSELLEFTLKVYKDLILQENEILSSTPELLNNCTNRTLCRLDIAVAWDSSTEQFKYIVNEVRSGFMGLFQHGSDCRMSIPWAFVDALERGAHLD